MALAMKVKAPLKGATAARSRADGYFAKKRSDCFCGCKTRTMAKDSDGRFNAHARGPVPTTKGALVVALQLQELNAASASANIASAAQCSEWQLWFEEQRREKVEPVAGKLSSFRWLACACGVYERLGRQHTSEIEKQAIAVYSCKLEGVDGKFLKQFLHGSEKRNWPMMRAVHREECKLVGLTPKNYVANLD